MSAPTELVLANTADHFIVPGDEERTPPIEVDLGEDTYRVVGVKAERPYDVILSYGLALVPARVTLTLEKVE